MSAAPEWFVAGIVGKLIAAYPSWPCHAGTVQVFWDALGELPRAELERATIAHIAQETAWPIAAKLRALAKMNHDDSTLTASEAWEEMYRHRHAHTRNPKWSSPAVERAAEAVRWNDPDWLSEQIPTIRAQFERYYNALSGKEKRNEALLESENLYRLSGMKRGPDQLYGPGWTDAQEEA
jgi:hypothetical protein